MYLDFVDTLCRQKRFFDSVHDMMKNLLDWLSLADYEKAKNDATNELVSRFCRRNVSIQNGWHIDSDDLKELSKEGDRAMNNISETVKAFKEHANKR